MRVAVISKYGTGAALWQRLAAEGCDVRVWIKHAEQKHIGDGLVPKAGSFPELLAWAKENNALVMCDDSGTGDLADQARKARLLTVGGGSFCDKLEKDRAFGQEIAQSAGCRLPPYEEFNSFAECLKWAQSAGDVAVYWKSDADLECDATQGCENGEELAEYLESVIRRFGDKGKCVVQEKIEGVTISTARWWNGRTFVGPYEGTFERKKCFNDEIGPATGCAFNALWYYDDEPDIAHAVGFPQLEPLFLKHDAPPGIYDINAIVHENGDAYFLEFTPRMGYDSEPVSSQLTASYSQWLLAVAQGGELPEWSDELAYGLRVTIPPYPWEHAKREMKRTSVDVEVRGEVFEHIDARGLWDGRFLAYDLAYEPGGKGMHCASPEGILGVACAVGDSLTDLDERCQETAKAIRPKNRLYRTDGATCLAEDAENLARAGYEVHGGLLE